MNATEWDEVLEFSDPCDEIVNAFAKAQKNFGRVRADQEGKVDSEKAKYTYKYADLAGVIAATQPALNAEGIAFFSGVSTKGALVRVETRLALGNQWIRSRITLESTGTAAQKIGSAATYARRYSAQAVLGVAPADDDDGKGASTRDESDVLIADLRRELEANAKLAEERYNGMAAIGKRLLARVVPPEWQAATAARLSDGRTKVWAELAQPELIAFNKALIADFPATKTGAGDAPTVDPAPEGPATVETPAAADSAPATTDPEPTPQEVSEAQARDASVAWIETKLADLPWVTIDDLQSLANEVREKTLAAYPDTDLASTYDWKALTKSELDAFWKIVPKRAPKRETAGAV